MLEIIECYIASTVTNDLYTAIVTSLISRFQKFADRRRVAEGNTQRHLDALDYPRNPCTLNPVGQGHPVHGYIL